VCFGTKIGLDRLARNSCSELARASPNPERIYHGIQARGTCSRPTGGKDLGDKLKDDISSDAEQARSQAAGIAQSAKEQSWRFAEQQKQAGAHQIKGIARALDGAAQQLEKDMPQASEFARDIAGRLESAAWSLRERSVDDLFRQAGNFARQQPATFFAGAVVGGFALARFFKSCSTETQG
jgi:hypothetical protein